MNATGEALLNHPHPCGHIVFPYTNEAQFIEAVCLFTSAGLRKGDSALLVMEQSHREPIRRQLRENGFDLADLESRGQLICETAEPLMATFIFDGIIDEDAFKDRIADLIERAKEASSTGQVRVSGEMVNLLWMESPEATHRLEELWNEVIKLHSVPLLCAYALGGNRPDVLPASLVACHSAAVV
jgi:hypothetical protein